jgi:hypothetical protein
MDWIQWLMRSQNGPAQIQIRKNDQKGASSCKHPKCASCLHSKMHRRTAEAQTTIDRKDKESNLSKEKLKPGELVHVDQFESPVRGRLPNTYGKEKAHERYGGGTIYIDAASDLVFVRNQVSLAGPDTVKGKRAFEMRARLARVTIKQYHGDNGIFAAPDWRTHCTEQGQTTDYSGVGAHHQNGKAERTIRTIVNMARAMLLHALIHWPETTTLDLWPFAIQFAVYIWNNTPKRTHGLTPVEIFTGVRSDRHELQNLRDFGCPTYVRDPVLQDGKKIPKWKLRSRVGQFLGFSDTTLERSHLFEI